MSIPADGRYGRWAGHPEGVSEDKRCCQEQIFPAGRGELPRQCRSKWTIQRDKHRYCGKHDPEKVKARRAAKDSQWKAEVARNNAKYDLQDCLWEWHEGKATNEQLHAACRKVREQ